MSALRRPYHVFQGFNVGFKDPSKWIGTPHFFCPYCAGNVIQIGTATYQGEVFSLHRCIDDACSKLCEGKEDSRRNLYLRYDKAAKNDFPPPDMGTEGFGP